MFEGLAAIVAMLALGLAPDAGPRAPDAGPRAADPPVAQAEMAAPAASEARPVALTAPDPAAARTVAALRAVKGE